MVLREQRQQEAVEAYLQSDKRSIIYACPRFGKIKVALEIVKRMDVKHIWILAPRNDIFKGWDDDMKKFDMKPRIVGRSTFTSIKKINTTLIPKLIIIDEPHELSVNQQTALAKISKGIPILGLTGTMTNKTRQELYDSLTLDVCYQYSIAQGVKEGILADYTIEIHKVPLNNNTKNWGKKSSYTEKKWFDTTKYLKDESDNPKTKHMMNLRMINIIQNSLGKLDKTIELISKNSDKRILVFCGVTNIADSLHIPVYHSKAKETEIFNNFCEGKGMHLATIKMMQAGITITPINLGIVNYMSGNPEDSAQKICRFLGLEYANPDKKAYIHIVSSDEPFEIERLKTGLNFFDRTKIINL